MFYCTKTENDTRARFLHAMEIFRISWKTRLLKSTPGWYVYKNHCVVKSERYWCRVRAPCDTPFLFTFDHMESAEVRDMSPNVVKALICHKYVPRNQLFVLRQLDPAEAIGKNCLFKTTQRALT